ncbi:MAG: hypothetical protein D6775_10255 [Caldilineae bacterium]|nr:MAG: hypothetical protein D6775_10255 [Caldilineae bacterium]
MIHRKSILRLVLLSLVLVLLIAVGASADPMVGGDSAVPTQGKAGYVGSSVCKNCHGDIYNSLQETLHPWKVRPKEEATIVGQFPVTMNGVTYTLDDVDWVIGAKPKWKQRYIRIADDGTWEILPIQWNIATQEWVPYSHAGDYRDGCAGCHTTGYDPASKTWKEPGIQCEACHGPGQEHASGGFANPNDKKIYAKPDAEVCGACHTRGKTKDGQFSWPEGYVPGGNVHIEDVFNTTTADTKWWYDNPDDANDPYHAKSHHQQYPEWQASRHSTALENIRNLPFTQDSCLECHSQDYRENPTTVTKETAQFGVTCQTCHLSHASGTVGSQLVKPAYELCTECHNGHLPESGKFDPGTNVHHPMKEMFEGIGFPGIEDMPSPHFRADGGATCNSCHMPKTAKSATPGDITSHRMKVVMPGDAKEGEPDSCTGCHTNASKEGLQKLIDNRQATIRSELAQLKQLGADAGCGDFDGSAPADGASDACKTAFTGYKMVHEEGSFGIHNYYYAKAILKASIEALGGQVYSKPYVGSATCAACHGDYYTSYQNTLHPWKVRPKAEAQIVGNWPVEWDGTTYTLDDVDWVIGARPKWKQRYIHIAEDGTWEILPFQWNIATQEFVAYNHAGDYRDGCAGCHTTGYDVNLKQWSEPGITCESCHGPGQAHVLSADKQNNPQIVRSLDSEICGACHTRGKTKDGQYGWPEGYVPGGSVHIEDVFDTTTATSKWWYDNPADPTDPGHAKSHHQQYPEWQRSKHAMALDSIKNSDHGSEVCLACHSEDYRRDPGNVTLETAQNTIECVTCHATHEAGAEGTSQLRMRQYELCVQCHNGTSGGTRPIQPGDTVHHPMQEMFEGTGMPNVAPNPSRHFQAVDEGGGPVCSSCHFARTAKSATWFNWDNGAIKAGDIASHLLKPVLPGNAAESEPDACSTCHSWPKASGQGIIDTRQNTIQGKLDELGMWLTRLNIGGVSDDNTAFAKTADSFVASDGSRGVHNFGYAQDILDAAIDAVNDYTFTYMPTILHP